MGEARKRQAITPKRRILPQGGLTGDNCSKLVAKLRYVGSANHKSRPGDYGFHPAANPRPWKSICDGARTILKDEAQSLLEEGARRGLVSKLEFDGLPKYVWSVDEHGEAYEAKLGNGGYHGYRLENEDPMRKTVLKEWRDR